MNEKIIIKKITLLKLIQPQQSVLKDIKNGVYKSVGIAKKENNQSFGEIFTNISLLIKSYRYLSLGVTFAFLLLLFSFVTSAFLPDQIHKIILYTKVALAPNRYEKARLALADITYTYKTNTILEKNNLTTLSQELAFTNAEMSNLKLKGEKGKYTKIQCHELYQQYLTYLKEENIAIPTAQQPFSSIKSQIITYREQAEQKLNMYPRL